MLIIMNDTELEAFIGSIPTAIPACSCHNAQFRLALWSLASRQKSLGE